MRIALTHAYSWPDVRRGAERMIHELSMALAARDHEVTVLTAGSTPGRGDEGGVEVIRLRRRAPSNERHEIDFGLRLVPLLARRRFDVVHSLGPRDAVAAIWTARIGRRHRTVYTNLGLPIHDWWDHRPERRAHERIVKAVDVYGCMSQFALRALATEYGRTGVLTPGGVNLEQFVPSNAREKRPTVLFSGALSEPHKGAATLLQAAGQLRRDFPDLVVWLSGPGDPEPLIAAAPERVVDHVRVLPLGDPTDQASRYGQAWVTALPSKGDSFGMVLVESLACGTPIVASTHSALPELVSPGMTGALCEPLDVGSLVEALRSAFALAQNPKTIEACRESARRYDWKTALAPMFERYYEAAEC
jgi:phosphatidylinositol alpha-mannosyltransferase